MARPGFAQGGFAGGASGGAPGGSPGSGGTLKTPFVITSVGYSSIGSALAGFAGSIGTPSAAAWPAANRGIYIPFVVDTEVTALTMKTHNGGTAAGNIDVGIYRLDLTKVVSTGPVAMSGTNTRQTFDITNSVLVPGTYFMAMSCSDATATFLQRNIGSAARLRFAGVTQQASVGTLPDPIVPAVAASDYIPILSIVVQ